MQKTNFIMTWFIAAHKSHHKWVRGGEVGQAGKSDT